VIKVGGGVVMDELDDFVESLSFLHNVGLCPIVIHGGGPQLNDELAKQGIVSDYIEGQRITTPEIIRTAQKIFAATNAKLVHALESKGVRARPIISGVFKAEANDPKLGLVGEIVDVNTQPIISAIEANCIPVLTCMGFSDYGQNLNINADVAAREVAKAIRPFKIIYISAKGGIVDQHGKIISNIDLRDDFGHLLQQPWFKHGDRLKLRQIKDILDFLPSSSSVAITSAKLLAEELFTHRGSGTLIRNYERILSYEGDDLKNVDVDRLLSLVENAFDAKLSPDYWNSVKDSIHKIYVSAEYRATAIVTKLDSQTLPDVSYLDKFAVNHQFRSEGLGNRIWKRMVADNPKLVWRSRNTNV
jgi:acetylglutamate kinase